MNVTFYGVRGSIPTPGPDYVKYGGNTACVHVELSDGSDLIFDAGTGIRVLGKKLIQSNKPINIILSHNHWDHIQGFPFFAPIYQPGRQITVTPGLTNERRPKAFLEQMSGSLFPVPHESLQSNINIHEPKEDHWQIGKCKITRLGMNHPGGGCCYLLEDNGKKLAYITDNELYPPYQKTTDFLHFVDLAKNVDLLIHDAQYVIEDMPGKSGWGHSVAQEAIKLALAANAKNLALYSHDPERNDSMIDAIVEEAQEIIAIGGGLTTCVGAMEGMQFTL